MKDIRELTFGNDGVALEFRSKRAESQLQFIGGEFTFQAPLNATIVGSKTQLSATAALDFGSIAANTTAELTVTVTGVVEGTAWNVFASPVDGIETGLTWSSYISADNTVTIVVANSTVGAIDPASLTWKVTAIEL